MISPGARATRRTLSAAISLLLATATNGCVSSSTWAGWRSTRERLDQVEVETEADASAIHDVDGGSITFSSCDDVVRTAIATYPGLAAPRERARSALATARAEGALPAPSVRVTAWDFPIGDPSLADREGMYMLGVVQELPPPDSLDADARASVEEARAALGELAEMRREVASSAAHDCADWAGAAWLHTRLLTWITSIEAMRDAVTARYSAAGGSLADVARVERELATAERMVARTVSDEEQAAESLRARFGLPSTTSIGAAPALRTSVAMLDAGALLDYALEHRGVLEAGRAGVAAARARALAAEARAAVPTFMLGGMYMQTPEARAGLGLELGMTLPWLWSGEPALAEAARAEASAAEADVLGLERTIEIEVRTAIAGLETRRRVLEALRGREARAAALALEATSATYGAGEGSLLEWLDAARAIRELEIEEAELLMDVGHALADVTSATGASLGELDQHARESVDVGEPSAEP